MQKSPERERREEKRREEKRREEKRREEKRREEKEKRNTKLLLGWKQIANYLGMGVRTVQRHEQLNGLPIRRPAGHTKSAVIATIAELDAWIAASPIGQSFKLRTQLPAANTMASLGDGIAKMRGLRAEMQQLRKELRDSMNLLHSSIQGVGVRPTPTYPDKEGDPIDLKRKPKRNGVLNLVRLNVKGRQPV